MTGGEWTWLDGAPAAALPLPDRGLLYGDGLFETLLLHNGSPLFMAMHMDRLRLGLHALGFPDCSARAEQYLRVAADEKALRAIPWACLRLTLTRGAGPRGYAPPQVPHPRVLCQAEIIDRDCRRIGAPANLVLADLRLAEQPRLAGIKHLNRLEQVLASRECRAAGADECLLLDTAGRVVSTGAGNLFLVRGGRLVTPFIRSSGVAGTRRRLLLERWAPALGVVADEAELHLDDLLDADELFYTNSLQGLRPVGSLGARQWQAHPVCEDLFAIYREELV